MSATTEPGPVSNENKSPEAPAPATAADAPAAVEVGSPLINEKKEITVFHDAENYNVKHPLMHKWTLWYTKPPTGKGCNWNELLKEVVTFGSVEEFWGIYNNITPASQIGIKADYHLFKAGVRPEWEDIQNKHGGRWSYTYEKKSEVPIDDVWLSAQLAAIGETLEASEKDNEVMGVVVNVRSKFYRVSLWTRSAGKALTSGGKTGNGRTVEESKEVLVGIGSRFKEALKLMPEQSLEFYGHTESASGGSSRARAKFSV
ncbi:eukaryotic translation initiation factor 4E [Ascosphaera acerosa]|nr:eukaryotic translation initiation factor 4E [Ascosphaera acerosa]